MTAVTPGGGLTSDVGAIINRAFPNGKPEMAASDFKKAYDITKASLAGSPRPAKTSLDYPTWAHCLMVEWKVVCDRERAAGRPEPTQMLCPECGTAMLLDHSQSDVLTCVGGCNRAITFQAFTALFRNVKPPPKPSVNPFARTSSSPPIRKRGAVVPTPVGGASIAGSIPDGQDPVAAGIVEKMPKSRKPLTSWRVWNIIDDGLSPRMKSLNGAVWQPMDPMYGKCWNVENPDHVCPSWHHRCGVYSVKTLEDTKRWKSNLKPTSHQVSAVGRIEMWGRVLEYKDGYRSEYVYPLQIWLPEDFEGLTYTGWSSPQDLADKLWETYLCEVNLSSDVIIDLKEPRG